MKQRNVVIFMTACINPKGMNDTKLQNVAIRRSQYLAALNHYLGITPPNIKILFVENSGEDISPQYEKEIGNGKMEVITFDGNDYNRVLGKGYGEALILRKGIEMSKIISHDTTIIKVSGRHIVKNLNLILQTSQIFIHSSHYVVCDINKKTRGANSDMFIASKDFYDMFLKNTSNIDESKGIWFEHVLFDSIEQYCRKGNEFVYLPVPLNQEGQSGSTGEIFRAPTLKTYFMNMAKAILYRIGFIKV